MQQTVNMTEPNVSIQQNKCHYYMFTLLYSQIKHVILAKNLVVLTVVLCYVP